MRKSKKEIKDKAVIIGLLNTCRLDIDRIAFFGRTYTEYLSMFDLSENELQQGHILDCPAGASSFAAEAHKLGFDVTACDILYNLPADELIEKGRRDMQHVFEKFDEVNHLYLVGLDAKPYPYLDDILSFFDSDGINIEIMRVPFEFQKGANKMLKLSRK